MIKVILYTRSNCSLCAKALQHLESLKDQFPHEVVLIDIDDSPELERIYDQKVPVVEIGPYRLSAPFTRQDLMMTMGAATDREAHLDRIADEHERPRSVVPQRISTSDRLVYWFSRHYLAVFNVLVFIYVGLPFLAPMLLKVNATAPAAVIYRIYSGLCHQYGYRSWYLFGEQPFYPREAAGLEGFTTFDEATGLNSNDIIASREFVGNETLGYKVAYCQRDIAIYGSILVFGLMFALLKRKLPPLPWYLWVFIGMAPAGLDGLSQLLSQPPFNFWAYRESTPLLRTVTGFLFGFTTAWFGYPLFEETMEEARQLLTNKFAKIRSGVTNVTK